MNKAKSLISAGCILCLSVLSACSSRGADSQITVSVPGDSISTAVSMSSVTDESSMVTTETESTEIAEESTAQTASPDDVCRLIDEAEIPEINITEYSTPEEIMLAGKEAGMYYGKTTEKYFGYGGYYNWKFDFDESTGNYRSDGLYTDQSNNVYAPMDYAEAKQFMIDFLGLTENGFEELCNNSPSSYYDTDGYLCIIPGDGGQAGWSYSYIIDYELGDNTVTYNCARVGAKEEWGYDEDLIEPFTFRLALEDGVWKLDGCSYGEGFFYWIIGLESDIEPYFSEMTDFESSDS